MNIRKGSSTKNTVCVSTDSGVGNSKQSAVAKSPSEPVEKQPVLKHPQVRYVIWVCTCT